MYMYVTASTCERDRQLGRAKLALAILGRIGFDS